MEYLKTLSSIIKHICWSAQVSSVNQEKETQSRHVPARVALSVPMSV